MSIAKQIRQQVMAQLQAAGMKVYPAWEKTALPHLDQPAAIVGAVRTKNEDGAFWNYLGTEWLEEAGCPVERYGRRFCAELFVEVYVPRDQAEALEDAIGKVELLAAEPSAAAVSVQTVQRGEVRSDAASGYLKCRCTVTCTAYFTLMRDEEGTVLTDFILKGVVQ